MEDVDLNVLLFLIETKKLVFEEVRDDSSTFEEDRMIRIQTQSDSDFQERTKGQSNFPEVPIIEITPPTTASNFLGFNIREEEDLNSDFLMAPVNEADYDSETQYCMDVQKERGPEESEVKDMAEIDESNERSYYDHFTTKRKKKKCFGFKMSKKLNQPLCTPITGFLTVPHQTGVPRVGVGKGVLASSAALRRLATGRMPPMDPEVPLESE